MLRSTFKENCLNVRSTKIVDVVKPQIEYGISFTIYDHSTNVNDVKKEYNLITLNSIPKNTFDAIVLGVSHAEFLKLNFAGLQKTTVCYTT